MLSVDEQAKTVSVCHRSDGDMDATYTNTFFERGDDENHSRLLSPR